MLVRLGQYVNFGRGVTMIPFFVSRQLAFKPPQLHCDSFLSSPEFQLVVRKLGESLGRHQLIAQTMRLKMKPTIGERLAAQILWPS